MTFRRALVALLLVVLLLAAFSGQANSLAWDLFTPVFLLLGLAVLQEKVRPYTVLPANELARISRAPRGPPLF